MNITAYLVSALLLGSNWYATRVSLHGYRPMTAAALRFAIAGVIFLVILAVSSPKRHPSRRELGWLVFAGLLNAVQYALFYFALGWISGGLAAVIFGTSQLFTALVAAVTRLERVSLAAVAGAPISILGLGFFYWDGLSFSTSQATGVALMFISVVVASFQILIWKHHGRSVPVVTTTTIFLTVSAIALGIVAMIVERDAFVWPTTAAPTVALLYQGVIGSAAAFGIYFYMLKRVTAVTASSMTLVLPVVALIIDYVAGEPLRLAGRSYIGVALTLVGVGLGFVLTLRRANAEARAAAAPAT